MNKEQQISILKQALPFLSKEDVEAMEQISTFRNLSNKSDFIKIGELKMSYAFILSGMLRGFFINEKGEEKNIFLRPELTLTAAPDCLFDHEPSQYGFQAIGETHLLEFKIEDFKALQDTHPNFRKVNEIGLYENIKTLIGRVRSLISETPEQRYRSLLKQSPQFFQSAYHKHIANYLGITAVSLSRIMKREQERARSRSKE